MPQPFGQPPNFLDPALTSDGKPYGPARFKEIVEENYVLAKFANISYSDTLKMSVLERQYLLKITISEINKQKEALEKAQAQKNR